MAGQVHPAVIELRSVIARRQVDLQVQVQVQVQVHLGGGEQHIGRDDAQTPVLRSHDTRLEEGGVSHNMTHDTTTRYNHDTSRHETTPGAGG